jgi:aryl-alcohol dehydrogenase-like predicted oxidoreductase
MNKIALGTVQFGINYGINNSNGIPSDHEIKSILNFAKDNQISFLDTANAYGNVEKKLGDLDINNFKIISKFSKVNCIEDLEKQLNNTLINLKINKIYGYMAHNADSLIEMPFLWDMLVSKKEKGIIEKIAVSLYTVEQLNNLINLKFIPDIIQIPFSIFDKKFEPLLYKLKNNLIEIHARSVFLQGFYFMNPKYLPKKLMPLKEPLKDLIKISIKYKISISSIALNYVLQKSLIDKVLIGVDSLSHLKNNLEMTKLPNLSNELIKEIDNIIVADLNLLNPTNW